MLRRRKRRQREQLFTTKKKGLFDDLTWTCHICHEERPDNKISVYTRRTPMDKFGNVHISESIRYCNDKPACIEAAPTHQLFKKED